MLQKHLRYCLLLMIMRLKKQAKKAGDLGLVIEPDSWRAKDALTVLQVYKELCAIEETSGTGSQDEKINALGGIA